MNTKITPNQFEKNLTDLMTPDVAVKTLPPVDDWHPEVIGEIDIRINREGEWFYQDDKMTREAMIKLFSTILRLDDDGFYYLVTPVEKMRITVDVAPFSVIDFRIIKDKAVSTLVFKTNLGDEVSLDHDDYLLVEKNSEGEPLPLLTIRKNLKGLINRNVFYRLVELAELHTVDGISYLGVWSGGLFHILDQAPD